MTQGGASSSLKIGLMAVAAVASLGFGVFRTVQALQVGAPPTQSAVAPVPAGDVPAAEGGSSTTPDTSVTALQGSTPASLSHVDEVDPFIPLPPAAPRVEVAPIVRPGASAPANTPLAGVAPPVLPHVGPTGAGERNPIPPASPAVPEPPELVGTLVGSRSSAVFYVDGATRAVPLGSSVAGWKVTSVEHGQVKLTGFGTERIVVLEGPGGPDPQPAPPGSTSTGTR